MVLALGLPTMWTAGVGPHTYIWQVLGVLIAYPLLSKRPDRWPVSFLRLWGMVNGFLLHASLSGQRSAAPARAWGFPSSPMQCIPSSEKPCFWKTPGLFRFSSCWQLWFCISFTVPVPKILNFIISFETFVWIFKQCLSVLGINGWVTILT